MTDACKANPRPSAEAMESAQQLLNTGHFILKNANDADVIARTQENMQSAYETFGKWEKFWQTCMNVQPGDPNYNAMYKESFANDIKDLKTMPKPQDDGDLQPTVVTGEAADRLARNRTVQMQAFIDDGDIPLSYDHFVRPWQVELGAGITLRNEIEHAPASSVSGGHIDLSYFRRMRNLWAGGVRLSYQPRLLSFQQNGRTDDNGVRHFEQVERYKHGIDAMFIARKYWLDSHKTQVFTSIGLGGGVDVIEESKTPYSQARPGQLIGGYRASGPAGDSNDVTWRAAMEVEFIGFAGTWGNFVGAPSTNDQLNLGAALTGLAYNTKDFNTGERTWAFGLGLKFFASFDFAGSSSDSAPAAAAADEPAAEETTPATPDDAPADGDDKAAGDKNSDDEK